MNSVILRELNLRDEGPFYFGAHRCSPEDLKWYSFFWNPQMAFQDYLKILSENKAGWNLPEGRVADTMLYGFLEHQIIGRVSIRHELNEQLTQRGGHLGYWIHPHFRGMGYGYEMVLQAVPYCRNLGLKKILITCAEKNIASIRIIEKLGAKLENTVWDETEKENVRRYWLTL